MIGVLFIMILMVVFVDGVKGIVRNVSKVNRRGSFMCMFLIVCVVDEGRFC